MRFGEVDGAGKMERMNRPYSLGYRPALDGLRGVAVLLVMATHFDVPGFGRNAGGVGVVLFFVLSGYLITALLRQELAESGRVDFVAFYLRRASRLLPALALVLAVVVGIEIIAGWHGAAAQAAASSLYYANWAMVAGVNMGAMQHAWTLGIEEQFYLVWPLLFMLLPRRAWVLGIGVALAAMLLRPILLVADPAGDWSFYSTFARADAILLGCALAFVPFRIPGWVALLTVPALAFVIVYPAPAFNLNVGLTLASLSGVLIVGWAAHGGWLGWRPLASVGTISYGLYLWNHPIGVVFRDMPLPLGVRIALMTALTFGLAIASYRWLERPAMRWMRSLPRSRPARQSAASTP